jgi:YD repeat-containing protein
MKYIVYLIPVLLIGYLILSFVLFKNRNKIKEKYQVHYISSFFFAAYMLTPFTIAIPALLSANNEEIIFPVLMSFIYPIIGLIIFLIVYRKKPMNYKIGKFFGMLGLGICAALIVVFKMLQGIHHYENGRGEKIENYTETPTTKTRCTTGYHYNEVGENIGHTDENGNHYDAFGKLAGHTDENGNHYDAFGKLAGHTDENGNHYNAFGKLVGHTDENGNHYDAFGKLKGHTTK